MFGFIKAIWFKTKWNRDKCWSESEKLDDWYSCEKDYIWDPGTCDG